jgi:cell division septation protein DedD
MASGGKRGAGERVLESKHVIGLFLVMLLFSGLFFTLGYVMGRNQYDGQVRAAAHAADQTDRGEESKHNTPPRNVEEPSPPASSSDPAISSSGSDWDFFSNNKPAKSEPHLEPVPKSHVAPTPSKPVNVTEKIQPAPAPVYTPAPAKTGKSAASAPLVPNGASVLQVAALLKQDDALAVASSLQKKHFAAFVLPPQKDKYYRVQVGPFKDQKSADAAKKSLEGEGFKAFYAKH